jgi:hypothetical protein
VESRAGDNTVGFGQSNYPVVAQYAHGPACSQVTVERAIKTTAVEFSLRIQTLQWQAAHRHQACGSNYCRGAHDGSGSANDDASARHSVVSCILSWSVQGSSSDETGRCTPSLGNELVEFVYAASNSAAAAVEQISLGLQFEGVVCPGTTCDTGSSAEM